MDARFLCSKAPITAVQGHDKMDTVLVINSQSVQDWKVSLHGGEN